MPVLKVHVLCVIVENHDAFSLTELQQSTHTTNKKHVWSFDHLRTCFLFFAGSPFWGALKKNRKDNHNFGWSTQRGKQTNLVPPNQKRGENGESPARKAQTAKQLRALSAVQSGGSHTHVRDF